MDNTKPTDGQRIEKVIRHLGMTVNAFAHNIGLNRSENLYQIKNGKHGISKEIAEQIVLRYPDISKAWLLTGEGEMLVGLHMGEYYIKCYDADVLSMASENDLPAPNYNIGVPRFRDADFAACSFDRAMDARIPVGATVALKRIGAEEIVPGYDYVIVTGQHTLLRTIHREPFSREIRLSAPDKRYNDIIMDVSDILKLYRILGYICYSK